MMMQAGFLCLETGFRPGQESINVAFKNARRFLHLGADLLNRSSRLMFERPAAGAVGTSGFFFDGSLTGFVQR